MATKDNNSSLLSKMVRFVRHPTKDWSELDKPEPEQEQEDEYSKQVLQKMIERKRKNDFVRRREFDHLRKLRRDQPSISPDLAGRPSFFQTSIPSNLEERATTLKKIDEIEVQMSKQWWQGKQDEASVHGGNFSVAANPPRVAGDSASMSVAPGESDKTFAPTQPFELSLDFGPVQSADYESTQMGLPAPDDPASTGGQQQAQASRSTGSGNFEAGSSEFSAPKLFPAELGEGSTDPDLEEAAIRFANGDSAGAEVGLLAALQADKVDPDSAEGWAAALFDLYRATGQQANFDRVAIDYAQRFGRSAPAWFSTPDLLGRKVLASPWDQLVAPEQTSQPATAPMGLDAVTAGVVELSGEVLGDAAEALDKLQAELKGANCLVISCARLIRVDFSAAGSILNWVAVREAEGCHVEFSDVPRLVAAFFNVIGINEHARVMVRTR